jgi:outer membrane receptor protein involved in Fe transport
MHSQTPSKILVFVAAGLLFAPVAQAQDLMLEEIVVTAQKREQTLTDVPAAVSTLSGALVNDFLGGAQDIRALAARHPATFLPARPR